MKLSVILTINNRTPEVSQKVADSFRLPGNTPDEFIIILDRADKVVRNGAHTAYSNMGVRTVFRRVPGLPGWKGPAKAWNAGFESATGDLFYCISSEVVQDAGNIDKARKLAENGNTAVFGSCHNSVPSQLVVGVEPGLLVSSKLTRPLGFIVCMPASNVRTIGGFDEEFMKGFWYDDDDFFLRLWNTGIDFVFNDTIHGIHLDHDRPDLKTEKGHDKIHLNSKLMLKKHNTLMPWQELERIEERREGQTTWKHP